MRTSLVLTILWGIVLIGRVMQWSSGESPTWSAVFFPLTMVFFMNLADAIVENLRGGK